MPSCFDCFFEEYKKLLIDRTHNKRAINWTMIVALLLVILSCLVLIIFRMRDVLSGSLAFLILVCTIVAMVNMNPYFSVAPNKRPYLDHLKQVAKLLEKYGIHHTHTERIKTMIEYANTMITRRDPFVDIKRAVIVTGSATAVVISLLSGALDGNIDLIESIPYLVVTAIFVFLFVMCFSPISDFLDKLFAPNKLKYKSLIDDLTNILIFDVDHLLKAELETTADNSQHPSS